MMLLKIYSGFIIILDVLVLIVKILLLLLESLYRKIFPLPLKTLTNEIILVTGAGHGIGKELSLQLAELGATLVCWDINKEFLHDTVKQLATLGYKAYPYECDVSNRSQVLEVAQKIKNEVGEVSIIINNAGIMPCHPFMSHNPKEIQRIFDINVMAHFWTLEAFLPSMIRNDHGHVVALSSMAGVTGIANLVPYCASKYAVRGLMDAMAEELRVDSRHPNVKFTTICPFIVETGLCKRPKSRFPNLLAFVDPKKAASDIIYAMRSNRHEVSIPFGLLELNMLLRFLPEKAGHLILDFLDSGVDSHDD